MKKTRMTAISLLLILFCGVFAAVDAEEIMLVGTDNGEEVFKSLAAAFEKLHPGVSVSVPESIDSGGGIKAVGEDKALIARVARDLENHEKKYGLTFIPFGKVQIAFFVNNGIKIKGLTSRQLADIYSGKIKNWQDAGGKKGRIRVVRREEGDSATETIEETLEEFEDIQMVSKSKTVYSDTAAMDIVKQKKGAVGFAAYGAVKDADVNILRINGKHPEDQDYPCAHQVGLIFKEKNNTGIIKQFIEFATSEAAREAIKKAGAMPM